MVALGLAVSLAMIGVAVFPCWRHSAGWGYAPSALAGVLLVLVALLTVGDRVAARSPPTDRGTTSPFDGTPATSPPGS